LRRLRADEPSGAPRSQVTPASFLQLQESDDSGSDDLRRRNERSWHRPRHIVTRIFASRERERSHRRRFPHARYLFSKPRDSILIGLEQRGEYDSIGPRRVWERVEDLFVKPHRGRFSGVAASTRLDRVEICDVGRRFQTADATARRRSKCFCGADLTISGVTDHVRSYNSKSALETPHSVGGLTRSLLTQIET
jgi:hypothetical protein